MSSKKQSLFSKLEKSVSEGREWKIQESTDRLWKAYITADDASTTHKTRFFRRMKALLLREREDEWANIVLKVIKDLLENREKGTKLRMLDEWGLLNSLRDFVVHLKYFEDVASVMESMLKTTIEVQGHRCSQVHDVDKLDPIMLAGYAERFDEGDDQSPLWKFCLDHHVASNPHHQGHPLWTEENEEEDVNKCPHRNDLQQKALLEMICDKASRRLQKELEGRMSPELWDINEKWFQGLPEEWMQKCKEILAMLKAQAML